MAKVLITGSKGNIGKVLTKRLTNHTLTEIDREHDVRDYKTTLDLLDGQEAVIHLAWEQYPGNWMSPEINPDNVIMFSNIYLASVITGVKRLIMPSSIHVNDWMNHKPFQGRLSISTPTNPPNAYGRTKVLMEEMGRKFANPLEVVCIRFGGVCPLDVEPWPYLDKIGLTHSDCADLVDDCLTKEVPKTDFVVLYGISKNRNGIYDLSNPLGWIPKQDAADFYGSPKINS